MDAVKTQTYRNEKQLVNEHCQREKLGNPVYTCTTNSDEKVPNFFCTLTIGATSFCTPNWEKTKKGAILVAAKLAVAKFNLTQQSGADKKPRERDPAKKPNGVKTEGRLPKQTNGDSTVATVAKEADWITIEKVEDIYKYLTDEVLAQEFKAFLHCKAQEDKKSYPVFTCTDVGEKGFTATLSYDDLQYKSIGMMLSKKQAEQSAAEMCLRSLGDFPAVPQDQYTIQPYRGGRVNLMTKNQSRGSNTLKKYIPPLLQFVTNNIGLRFPMYYSKEIKDENGVITSRQGACTLEGKIFESSSTDIARNAAEARNSAASLALEFFGITDLALAAEFRDMLRIRKRRTHNQLGPASSPFTHSPSLVESWIFYHFEPLEEYKGGEELDCSALPGLIDLNTRNNQRKEVARQINDVTLEGLLSKILSQEPTLNGVSLVSAVVDLAVGEIDEQDKNLVTLGNNQYSVKMYCEGGKIHCAQRSCDVELLAGHNIRGLKCNYKITVPGLEVYIKAVSCDDVFFPNPPLPVLTSCGAVLMMYDHESSVQDLHILLTRPSSNKSFLSKAKSLASYLNKLIGATPLVKFDVRACVSTINAWSHDEIKLLSLMTMDSMLELMSPYMRYDDRWNEIFAKQLPQELKELQDAATTELKRREDDGNLDAVEESSAEWSLPNAPFKHKLIALGVLPESSIVCAYRSILHSCGLRVKLAELESSPYVDIAAEDNTNSHRGDVHRYYLWNGLRKVNKGEDDPYYSGADVTERLGEDWVPEEKRKHRTADSGGRQKFRQKRKADDDETVESKKPAPESEVTAEETAVPADEEVAALKTETEEAPAVEEDEQKPEPERDLRPVMVESVPGTVTVTEECKWFTIADAKSKCPVLNKLSETSQFQAQVKSLQCDANAFVKSKKSC